MGQCLTMSSSARHCQAMRAIVRRSLTVLGHDFFGQCIQFGESGKLDSWTGHSRKAKGPTASVWWAQSWPKWACASTGARARCSCEWPISGEEQCPERAKGSYLAGRRPLDRDSDLATFPSVKSWLNGLAHPLQTMLEKIMCVT